MADRPNVLVLMSDQHRPQALGCAGNDAVHTPNFDRLAERGVTFEEAYTTSPLCGPARKSFISGVYPHNTHMIQNGGWLPADDETVFQRLQEAGYYTGHVGKGHWGPGIEDHYDENEAYMYQRGFDYVCESAGTGPGTALDDRSFVSDEWARKGLLETFQEDLLRRREESGFWPSPLSVENHFDGVVSRRAIDFLDGYDRSEPFALFVGWGGPHDPLDPPEAMVETYDGADIPDAVEPAEPGDWVPGRAVEFMENEGIAGPTQDEWPAEAVEKANGGYLPTTVHPGGQWRPEMRSEEVETLRRYYYAKVSLLDHWLGEILDTLEARGELENTLVVYTSDHGEMAGDHGLLAKKSFFDASVRIPFIVSWPAEFETGGRTDALTEIIDIGPTVLDAATGSRDLRTFGESLVPVLGNPDGETTDRDAAFSIVRGHTDNHKAMVVTHEYKYAVDNEGAGYMLFDREADPDERENLLGHPDYADVERELQGRLLQFYHETCTQYQKGGSDDVIREPGLAGMPEWHID
jgi:choline-sulfatase